MNNSSTPTRKALALIMIFALLAPFAAVLTYFIYHKLNMVIIVFVVVALLYIPARFIAKSFEGKSSQ